jgi:hypothetical protein
MSEPYVRWNWESSSATPPMTSTRLMASSLSSVVGRMSVSREPVAAALIWAICSVDAVFDLAY